MLLPKQEKRWNNGLWMKCYKALIFYFSNPFTKTNQDGKRYRWDELYWNVTGNEWTVPIASTTSQVVWPRSKFFVSVGAAPT